MSINKEIGIGKVYVVHGIKGYETREERLNQLFKEVQLDFEYMVESHNDSENQALIKKYFADNIAGSMSRGAIYCTLVHILAYEEIAASNNRFTLVVENDLCLLKDFTNRLKLVVNEAKTLPEGFIISLENSTLEFPSWRKTKAGKYLYPAKAGRCAGAYLIDNKAAELMLNDAKTVKCKQVIDWWHNDLVDRDILKMYWAHPPLAEQGSFNGQLSSSISVRNNGNIRALKWQAQKFYKMYILRWFR